MSSMTWPDHLLTLDEWDALPEAEGGNVELVEGVLLVNPAPVSRHQFGSDLLCAQLNAALMPHGWAAIHGVEVVLVASFPPLVRVPDISVVSLDDARKQPKRYTGEQVRVAIEIASPGSVRTDRIMKLADYAEAGIGDYWILDLDGPITLDTFRLAGAAYKPLLRSVSGQVALDAPVPLTLDLDALVP